MIKYKKIALIIFIATLVLGNSVFGFKFLKEKIYLTGFNDGIVKTNNQIFSELLKGYKEKKVVFYGPDGTEYVLIPQKK